MFSGTELVIVNQANTWFSDNIVGIIGIVIGAIISILLFILSRQITSQERLKHKDLIQNKVDDYLIDVQKRRLAREVYLVNIKRYFKDYPDNDEKIWVGYSHIRAEIKSTRFDGVEFFSEMPIHAWGKPDGSFTTEEINKKQPVTVFPVSIIPYEWIEYIDLNGDEYGYVPLFFCHFKNHWNRPLWKRLKFFGWPYKRIIYYIENDTYDENRDHYDVKYKQIKLERE